MPSPAGLGIESTLSQTLPLNAGVVVVGGENCGDGSRPELMTEQPSQPGINAVGDEIFAQG